MKDSILYWIWLSSLAEVGINSKVSLIEAFGTAENAFRAPAGAFRRICGISPKDAEILELRDLSFAGKVTAVCEKNDIRILSLDDESYPERLRNIYAPPNVLYVKGNLPDIDSEPLLAVVGTRNATSYGKRMSRKISAEYVQRGGVIVSGLTKGIDASAAEGAVEAGGRVVGFLGVPITNARGRLYNSVLENGALISEYAPGTQPQKHFFRQRNRIGAGISVAAVAVEAPEKSGTLLFVSEALEQGKQIFAVPGNADSPSSAGTLQLIKDGAMLVTNGQEIADELGYQFPGILGRKTDIRAGTAENRRPRNGRKLNDTLEDIEFVESPEKIAEGLDNAQKAVVLSVAGGCSSAEEIHIKTGIPMPELLSQLTILEIKGILGKDEEKRFVIRK